MTHDAFDIHRAHPGPGAGDHRPWAAAGRRYVPRHGRRVPARAGLIYFTGILTLAAGLAILNVHHLWTRDWRVLITIFGWLFLIGGIFRILAMSMAQRVGESFIAHQRWPHGRHRHARARRVPFGHGLSGHLGWRQAAASSSHERGKKRAPGVAQRQTSPPQVRRGAPAALIARARAQAARSAVAQTIN